MSRKKNVLVFYYGGEYGGADVLLTNLVPGLLKKYNIILATVAEEGVTRALKDEVGQITAYRIPVKKPLSLFGIFCFARLLRNEKIDIILSFDLIISIYVRFFRIFFPRVKHVTAIIGNFRCFKFRSFLTKPMIHLLNRISYLLVDKFILVSHYLADRMEEEGIPRSMTEVVYNGIVLSDQAKGSQGKLPKPVHIAYIGRLAYEKGIDYFLEIAKRFAERKGEIIFHVFGQGKYYDEVMKAELAYPDLIKAHGFTDVIYGQYRIDVLVIPSRDEGLPYSALGGFEYGIPLIASRVGGLKEMIQDGENGLLCGVGDIDSFYSSINRLIGDDALRQSIIKGGRKTVEAVFSAGVMREKYLELLGQQGTSG